MLFRSLPPAPVEVDVDVDVVVSLLPQAAAARERAKVNPKRFMACMDVSSRYGGEGKRCRRERAVRARLGSAGVNLLAPPRDSQSNVGMEVMHGAHGSGSALRRARGRGHLVALACSAANGYSDGDAEHEPPHRVAMA